MILDTVAVSALFDGDPKLLALLQSASRHQLPAVVLGEYRYGLNRSRHRARLEVLLGELEQASDILPIDAGTAGAYARIREQLRLKGTPLPENDVWIAALAIQHEQPIASLDAHFDSVSGVKRIGW
jgi:predicted nucleic acid-binding protein